MNLKTEIFVLCDHATVSQDQKLSIIGIFDQFFVANLPTNWPKMYLVAVVKGEAGKEYSLTLKLTPPQKVESTFPDKEFKITLGQNGKANVMTELVNFPLAIVGVHKIQILNEKVVDAGYLMNNEEANFINWIYNPTELKINK